MKKLAGEQLPLFSVETVSISPLLPAKLPTKDPYWDKVTNPDQSVLEEVQGAFPEQVNNVLEEVQGAFPEHRNQWVEKYFVTRAGTKHYYYRYCYYDKKIHHIHINGGNISSKIAQRRKQIVEEAISSGKSPAEIKKLVKGVFGGLT
jgi:hypothetical protein